ncbi:MAG: DMT family transporter [Lentihominibacter sp.]
MGNTSKQQLIPLTVITCVIFIWGFDFIAIEYMLQYMSSGVFTLLRLITGSAVLAAVCIVRNKGIHIRKEDMLRIFISGASGMSLYFTLEGIGISLTSASFGSLILATVPVFGVIGDRIIYKRKITSLKLVCILISIAGVYLLVADDLSGPKLKGLGFIIMAAIVWVFQIACMKPLYEKYDLLTILTGIFISGAIFQVPLTLLSHPHFSITPAGIIILIATTIICLIIGETGYVYAIGNLSVTVVSAFENLLPVVTILLAFVIYGTMLTPLQSAGAVLITGSVMCIALKDS